MFYNKNNIYVYNIKTISFSTIPNSKGIKFHRLPPIGTGPNQGTYEG
jgi:hypothetical protein